MDMTLIAIVIGIFLGTVGSIIVRKALRKRGPSEGTKEHQIYAFVENMKSVGELVVFKAFTKGPKGTFPNMMRIFTL